MHTYIHIYTDILTYMFLYITQSMALPWVGVKKKAKLVNSNFICQVENEEFLIPL